MDEPISMEDREELRIEIALFRHSLVGALVSEALERGELTRTLHAITRRKHRIPGTIRTRVSVAALRRWLAAFRTGGFEALKPGLRNDYGHSRAIPEEWVKKAIALRQEVPARTAPTLIEILSRQPGYPGINVHTLDTTLRRLGMTRRQLKRPKKRVRRWSAKHVNDLWQGDATDGVWLPNPRDPEGKKIKTKLFLWIDDVSRLVPHAEFFYDEKLPRMERTLKLGILRRGLPTAVYTDNGAVFRASAFKASLASLKVGRIRSRPRAPRGRGKVERMFSVVQEQFYPEVYAAGIRRLDDLNEALWAWLERIYHSRIHSEIKKTPLDAYRDSLTDVRPADPVEVARAFLWRATRKVSGNGFISLLGNSYSVEPAWAGQKLELRFDPFDLSRIDVYRDGRPVARAEVRKLARGLALELTAQPLAPAVEPSGINFLDALRDEYRRQRAAEIGEIPFREALGHIEKKENA